jgi:hypothetical protein
MRDVLNSIVDASQDFVQESLQADKSMVIRLKLRLRPLRLPFFQIPEILYEGRHCQPPNGE